MRVVFCCCCCLVALSVWVVSGGDVDRYVLVKSVNIVFQYGASSFEFVTGVVLGGSMGVIGIGCFIRILVINRYDIPPYGQTILCNTRFDNSSLSSIPNSLLILIVNGNSYTPGSSCVIFVESCVEEVAKMYSEFWDWCKVYSRLRMDWVLEQTAV